jgi:hypothetical protein
MLLQLGSPDKFKVRPITRIAVVVVVSVMLFPQLRVLAWHPSRSDTDGLLRVVAQEMIKADPSIRCVLLLRSSENFSEVEPAPSELLKRLRKIRPTVATLGAQGCKDVDRSIDGVLFLGPIEWSQPRTARVYVGYPGPNGRGGYYARRSIFGRWQLTRAVLD